MKTLPLAVEQTDRGYVFITCMLCDLSWRFTDITVNHVVTHATSHHSEYQLIVSKPQVALAVVPDGAS